jgi:hypothetical protein
MTKKKKNNIISFPSSPSKLERQVEAILFAASEPLKKFIKIEALI